MRIVSWNVNGLRACVQKGFTTQIRKLKAEREALTAPPPKALLSPRSKRPQSPRKRGGVFETLDESGERQMQVEATLQAEVAKLKAENAKLRSLIPAAAEEHDAMN